MKQFLLFLGLCTILSSCTHKKEEAHESTKYLVSSPIQMDTVITKDYISQIHSIRNIELRALERGYLKSINIDEGQTVSKGQSLFRIMPNVYQAELQKAQAEANVARIELKNTQLLSDGNVVSPNELAMSKAKLDKALAEVSMAQIHLGFTNVKAPFDGIVDHLRVREGSLLEEGELLTTLSDNSEMWVYFNVPEAEYLDYAMSKDQGDKKHVRLLMANNKEFPHEGIVETIEGEFNNETGNIAFRATFPNPEGILRHGETGSVLMTIPLTKAIIIPQKATFEVLDKRFVFVIDENGIVQQREITVGTELPNLFVVEKGLATTDKILLEGIRLVKAGDHIEYEFVQPKKSISSLDLYAE
ncbi:hemolysin D [Nonlabens sp. YIK11]|uniref:efflux RND transporter periplasmic adaptor subunit n=1 Tax=Nonlabens sp. YIK11 TaxID=1453349 RepID=UPI0006DCD279|nr:efflux RND transporter periplasmic adaptor subunit [Nonlabens sp. YIK11]KQC33796.1 hemolysin D [Nonlabens sp. YIK11]